LSQQRDKRAAAEAAPDVLWANGKEKAPRVGGATISEKRQKCPAMSSGAMMP
jgi:hypothetical protein